MKVLIDAFQFTLTGTTMGRRYPLQNAILKKDTLDKEIVGGILDL